MNDLKKKPIASLGYHFIEPQYLPKGKDEYYLRNLQNRSGISYRKLTAYEIELLVRNRNTSDNWNNLLVSDAFTAELVQNCKFFGLVRIGKLEPFSLEFHNLRRPVGLYNSTIISSDFGDNVIVDNVNYLSHYIIGNEVMLVNINELATTDNAKFGMGILKQGEPESRRIWLEVCNENGGRSIIPFNGMLPGDAWLWSRYRDQEILQHKFKEFTEKKFDNRRGYYGKVGDRTVIKNCKIIKDVWIGTDAYLKGANKIKNVTINSGPDAKSQIGEGCEIVNGIIDYGCRIFYGVKAVRFIMASNSQLKYGARLINSYLGNNSTISCCEVLNSLIFPAHEQHHNNSFLCASVVLGQSNMAAGATIGSNHNSRSPDGEIIAGRGFWPGLCVSLKHNSKFASFNILAKGDYPAELNIPIPFSLVSNDVSKDELTVMPAYWFMYNMYAVARNAWKYIDRDKRIEKIQHIEYDFLAPDSLNEMLASLNLFEQLTGEAWLRTQPGNKKTDLKSASVIGKKLLAENDPVLEKLEIFAEGFEHSDRKVRLIKIPKAWQIFRELTAYYLATLLLNWWKANGRKPWKTFLLSLPSVPAEPPSWINVGGQLIPEKNIDKLLVQIKTGRVKGWDQIHDFYRSQDDKYENEKLAHALAAWKIISGFNFPTCSPVAKRKLFRDAIRTKEWMTEDIYTSRAKDYNNPFRQMVYDGKAEMETVTGKLSKNAFILQEREAFIKYAEEMNLLLAKIR